MSTIPAKALQKDLSARLLTIYDTREASNMAMELLLCFCQVDRMKLALNEPIALTNDLNTQLEQAVNRLLNQEPLQHIIGQVEFYGLNFKTDHRALIPRPETEELVDWIIKDNPGFEGKVLDIGTGTGCIPIALAHHIPGASVSAIDISQEALSLAKENGLMNAVEITWHLMDVLTGSLPDRYDLIVSNPPYIPEADKVHMATNVLDYEPGLALFVSNETPLIFYRRIAELAMENLYENGQLYFEIHEEYGKEVVEMLDEMGYKNITLKKDLQDKDRMVKAVKP